MLQLKSEMMSVSGPDIPSPDVPGNIDLAHRPVVPNPDAQYPLFAVSVLEQIGAKF